jgi:hypothetical protein
VRTGRDIVNQICASDVVSQSHQFYMPEPIHPDNPFAFKGATSFWECCEIQIISVLYAFFVTNALRKT